MRGLSFYAADPPSSLLMVNTALRQSVNLLNHHCAVHPTMPHKKKRTQSGDNLLLPRPPFDERQFLLRHAVAGREIP